MAHVHPDHEAMRALADLPDDGPVVMLNMLRFRPQAEYPEGSGQSPCTGRAAYRRYAEQAARHLQSIGGRRIWLGQAQGVLIGPAQEAWDEVFLVQYPSRSAFLRMVADRDYLASTVHRTAALADSRLIALRPAPAGE